MDHVNDQEDSLREVNSVKNNFYFKRLSLIIENIKKNPLTWNVIYM